MDNQHRKIKGYRELSQAEIDLMNRVKEQGEQMRQLIADLEAQDKGSIGLSEEQLREAARWRAIARTHLQEGTMALTRSVAKPEFF